MYEDMYGMYEMYVIYEDMYVKYEDMYVNDILCHVWGHLFYLPET